MLKLKRFDSTLTVSIKFIKNNNNSTSTTTTTAHVLFTTTTPCEINLLCEMLYDSTTVNNINPTTTTTDQHPPGYNYRNPPLTICKFNTNFRQHSTTFEFSTPQQPNKFCTILFKIKKDTTSGIPFDNNCYHLLYVSIRSTLNECFISELFPDNSLNCKKALQVYYRFNPLHTVYEKILGNILPIDIQDHMGGNRELTRGTIRNATIISDDIFFSHNETTETITSLSIVEPMIVTPPELIDINSLIENVFQVTTIHHNNNTTMTTNNNNNNNKMDINNAIYITPIATNGNQHYHDSVLLFMQRLRPKLPSLDWRVHFLYINPTGNVDSGGSSGNSDSDSNNSIIALNVCPVVLSIGQFQGRIVLDFIEPPMATVQQYTTGGKSIVDDSGDIDFMVVVMLGNRTLKGSVKFSYKNQQQQ